MKMSHKKWVSYSVGVTSNGGTISSLKTSYRVPLAVASGFGLPTWVAARIRGS